jgi:hypothetical protein
LRAFQAASSNKPENLAYFFETVCENFFSGQLILGTIFYFPDKQLNSQRSKKLKA